MSISTDLTQCKRRSPLAKAINKALLPADVIEAIDRALDEGWTGAEIMAVVHECAAWWQRRQQFANAAAVRGGMHDVDE